MKPGATTLPAASITVWPGCGAIVPMVTMRSPPRPTSAWSAGPPVPSMTWPLRMTISMSTGGTLGGKSDLQNNPMH